MSIASPDASGGHVDAAAPSWVPDIERNRAEYASGGFLSTSTVDLQDHATLVVISSDGQRIPTMGRFDDIILIIEHGGWAQVSSTLYINCQPGSYWVAITVGDDDDALSMA